MKGILEWMSNPDNIKKIRGIKNLGVVVAAISAIFCGIVKMIASGKTLLQLITGFFKKKPQPVAAAA